MGSSWVFFILTLSFVHAVSLNTYWNENDTSQLARVLEDVLQTKRDKIASLHYAASGLKLLNVSPSAASSEAVCEIAKKADLKVLETLYHASALSGDLPNCAFSRINEAQTTIENVLTKSKPNGETITQALRSADRLGIKVNQVAFDKLLEASMKDDDSPNNLAWVFNAAALLDKSTSAKYFDKIKNLVSQADEVDKRFLQFDGGLLTTTNALHGVMSLAELQGKVPAVTKDQMSLFTNYLLSRKHVFTEKSAFYLLSALGVLVNNHQLVPVITSLVGPIMADHSKPLRITVCNVFGLPVAASGVRVDITPMGTTTAIVSSLKLTQVKGSPKLYTVPADKLPEAAGFYSIAVKIDTDDKRLIGTTGSNILFKLSDDIIVDDLKVGVLEKDEAISGNSLASIAQFSKLGKILAADYTKRLYFSFSVKRKSNGNLVKPSQVFILFKHVGGSEVFYTADLQSGGHYIVDIYLATSHKDFEGLSGKYTANLIIGDTHIRTPLNWSFADFTLTLPFAPEEVIPKSQQIVYNALEEITHVFRQPEKRPAAIVSDTFTMICLSPLLLLIVLWLRIGLNFGNMPISIWTLLFHGSLAGLFTLYFVFWLQLNMFDTLKYLAVVSAFTYLSGNRVLRAIADKRNSYSTVCFRSNNQPC